MPDIGVEPAVLRIGHVRQPPEARLVSCRKVARIARCYRAPNEPVVLLVRDVDEPRQPLIVDSACESGMEIAVNVLGKRDRETRISAGGDKTLRAKLENPL